MSTQAEHHRVVILEDLHIGDVLRVTTIALGLVVLAAGRAIHVDQAIVVTCGDESLVLRHVHDVDVGAIRACWVDALDKPAELNGMIVPDSARSG